MGQELLQRAQHASELLKNGEAQISRESASLIGVGVGSEIHKITSKYCITT